jgi:histidinol-phosphate phosphatase family protein
MRPLPPVAILAGGLATRLRPLTETIPKSLVPVNGRPFIEHQLELLRACGIRRAVLCAGFLGDQIVDYVGNGARFGIEVQYSSEGERLLGTGGAIQQALPLLGERFFVLYGDSYLRCDYGAIFEAFCRSSRQALMTVFRNDDQWDMSNVEYSGGCIRAYSKRERTPQMHYIAATLRSIWPPSTKGFWKRINWPAMRSANGSTRWGRGKALRSCPDIWDNRKKSEARRAAMTNAVRAIFLDRDGVLNRAIVSGGKPYPPQTLEEFRLFPDARPAVEELRRAGFRLIVVTNQPDVARGTQSREMVERMHERLWGELRVDDIFVCWHDDRDGCPCRKPKPGLLFAAQLKHGIDLGRSFMVGDRWRDMEAGHRAGCRTIFIDYHYNERRPAVAPAASAKSLREATDWILAHETD